MNKKSFWNTPIQLSIKNIQTRFRKAFNSFFQWDKDKSEQVEQSKREARRPIEVDWTDSLQANVELTQGLYNNTYPGMKLSGSLAYNPIAIPIWFMGLPIPKSKIAKEQKILDQLVEKYMTIIKQIHLQGNRDGTIWVFPFYSAKLSKTVLEFIPDNIVTDIIRDIETREIVEIITLEDITVSTGYNETARVRRQRNFRRDSLTITWTTETGKVPNELKDVRMKNPIGILPIPFANNKDGDNVRGHSDLERILSLLKDRHDIKLAWSTMLAKFKVKMIQETENVDEWLKQNGKDSINEIQIDKVDFIFNIAGEEKTSFIFPTGASDTYKTALEVNFWEIVEGCGIPEMLWGPTTTGNHASSAEQMTNLVKFVQDKQLQYTESHKQLFTALLKLESISRMQQSDPEIIIEWNSLDAISEKVRSEILGSFASAMSVLITAAGITKQQVYEFYKKMFPEQTIETYDEFIQGLSEMAVHKQFAAAGYMEALGMDENSDVPFQENTETTVVTDETKNITQNKKTFNGGPGSGHYPAGSGGGKYRNLENEKIQKEITSKLGIDKEKTFIHSTTTDVIYGVINGNENESGYLSVSTLEGSDSFIDKGEYGIYTVLESDSVKFHESGDVGWEGGSPKNTPYDEAGLTNWETKALLIPSDKINDDYLYIKSVITNDSLENSGKDRLPIIGGNEEKINLAEKYIKNSWEEKVGDRDITDSSEIDQIYEQILQEGKKIKL